MAEAKGEYIAVNELKGTTSSTTAKDAVSVSYGSNKVRIAWAEGKRVWDVWETMLSANNFSIGSSATTITESLFGLQSYGTDRLGVKHQMTGSEHIEFSPPSITANTSTSNRTQNVVITQKKTSKSITVTATQAGRVAQSTTYGTPSVTSTSISTVAASGGTRSLTVYWSQTKTTTYDNETTSSTSVTGSSTATVTSGSAQNSSGAYISVGSVYVPSAGTNYYTSQRTAYTISQFNFTANGVSSGTVYRTVYVYQSANTRTSEYRNYSVSLSSTSSYVGAYNELAYITASGSKDLYYVYASGSSTYSSTERSKVTLSSSYGLFYSNGSYLSSVTVSSGTQVLFQPNENESSSNRTISVVGKNYDNTSVSKTLNLTQYAAEYYLEIKGANTIAASGGTLNWTVISTRNDKLYQLTKNNVSVGSGASIQSFSYDDINEDRYSLVLSVGNNSSTSSRYITVTVTQPNGETASRTITQAAASQPSQTITSEVDAYFMDYYTVWFEAFMYTTSGYINEEIYFKVQDGFERYSTVYGEYSYPPPVYDGEFISGEINVSSRFSPMYICVYVGDSLVKYRRIDE